MLSGTRINDLYAAPGAHPVGASRYCECTGIGLRDPFVADSTCRVPQDTSHRRHAGEFVGGASSRTQVNSPVTGSIVRPVSWSTSRSVGGLSALVLIETPSASLVVRPTRPSTSVSWRENRARAGHG